MCRHKALEGVVSDVSPIHWQYGAIARLKKGETIDKYLHNGYSTLSLGYIGLYELTYRILLKGNDLEKAFIDELRCRNGNLNIICGRVSVQKEEL